MGKGWEKGNRSWFLREGIKKKKNEKRDEEKERKLRIENEELLLLIIIIESEKGSTNGKEGYDILGFKEKHERMNVRMCLRVCVKKEMKY